MGQYQKKQRPLRAFETPFSAALLSAIVNSHPTVESVLRLAGASVSNEVQLGLNLYQQAKRFRDTFDVIP
jgi:hypothetical protein